MCNCGDTSLDSLTVVPTEMMMFIQIKMVQLKRYKFILIGLALFAVLLVYSQLPRRFFSVGGILRGPFKLPPKSNATSERYELVHKYEQERLPDVAFKRILFWNDVRTSLTPNVFI